MPTCCAGVAVVPLLPDEPPPKGFPPLPPNGSPLPPNGSVYSEPFDPEPLEPDAPEPDPLDPWLGVVAGNV
jgi:hypothetical protein